MTKRMLIDSTNAEETRVVVLDGNRLDEFDLETSTKHQLKGNIYLAKVVRVEPSLQAAFVEYGGNRHGFLAFGEIHPDYYQIPVADRKRLLEAQEQEAREDEEAEEQAAAAQDRRRSAAPITAETDDAAPIETFDAEEVGAEEVGAEEIGAEEVGAEESGGNAGYVDAEYVDSGDVSAEENGSEAVVHDELDPALSAASNDHPAEVETDHAGIVTDGVEPPTEIAAVAQPAAIVADLIVAPEEASALFPEASPEPGEIIGEGAEAPVEPEAPAPEQFGGEHDTEEPDRRSTPRFLRHYKIQEVIRRRQILLIQVVKEERGSKGAALTTYVSLAGRFSVLMPNSPRGGGISRKITSAADRRRLKEVTAELDLPRGMGLIVRTAGANRPKPEILRDCEYLLNQWDQIRDLTMKSMAPALIYEEASLIKRAIRDVYSRDVDDILVDGEQGWRAARDFMRMLMPTHARKVQLWKEPQPLFAKAQVEQQLEAMLQPTVQLRSGGYLVINQTEALVAIDVNSGRSTRERGIEETALKTNLEAAEEAARQLRLRDLAGLIVIDFIDMESRRNVAAVERKLKDALKHDRARIQVGGISHFGLLEMSRQRLRPSLAETNFVTCTHCGGTGHMRSTESAALVTLRAIEDEGGRRRAAEIMVHCASSIALYILNNKRQRLTDIETRYSMIVAFVADETLMPPQLRIEKTRAQTALETPAPVSQLAPPEPFDDPDEISAELDGADEDTMDASNDEADYGADADADIRADVRADMGTDAGSDSESEARPAVAGDGESADSAERRGRRRRRRRGGRREEGAMASTSVDTGAELSDDGSSEKETGESEAVDDETVSVPSEAAAETAPAVDPEEGERRRRGRRGGRRRRRDGSDAESSAPASSDDESYVQPAAPMAPTYTAPAYAPAAYTPPTYAPQAYAAPTYEGPTPANPFGGASAFDIFDAIEQAEEQRLTQRKPVPQSAAELTREPEPAPEPEIASEPMMSPAEVVSSMAAAPVAEPAPAPAPQPVLQRAPEPAPQSVLQQAPEPVVEAVAGPVIQPTLISGEAEPVDKKRGWWRR